MAALTLVAHHVLLTVTKELELFGSFSAWLRLQIDRLATTSAGEELVEKEAALDAANVLAYIRRYLVSSPLAAFLGSESDGEGSASGDWEEASKAGGSLLETVDEHLKKREAGQPFAGFLTRLGWLVGELEGKAGVVFGDVARAQERSVRFGTGTRVVLGGEIGRVDTCMDAVYQDVSFAWNTLPLSVTFFMDSKLRCIFFRTLSTGWHIQP